MLDIEYTHETIQKLAEGMNEYLHIDLSTPMTLEKLTKAISNIGIDIEYVNITDANNPLFVMSAEYKKRGCRYYVIKINKNKDEKNLLFRVAAEFGKIILFELPEDIKEDSPYTGSYSIKSKFGEKVDNYELFAIDIGPLISSCLNKAELYDVFKKNLAVIPDYIDIEELYDFNDKTMYRFTIHHKKEWFVEIEKCSKGEKDGF